MNCKEKRGVEIPEDKVFEVARTMLINTLVSGFYQKNRAEREAEL